MAKRGREGNIINHNKRALEQVPSGQASKKQKVYEYWHHKPITRLERSKIMTDMYIKLIYSK